MKLTSRQNGVMIARPVLLGMVGCILGIACVTHPAAHAPAAPGAAATSLPPSSPKLASKRDYPPTRRDEIVDVLHGVRVADPYRWLEGDGPEVTRWFEAQDQRTRRELAKLGDVEVRYKEILELWKPLPNAPPLRRKGLSFQRGPGGLFVKKDGGVERRVVDTSKLEPGVRLADFTVSNDGRWIAAELSKRGADMHAVRVIDVASARVVDEIGGLEGSAVVWSRSGFFYSFTPVDVPHAIRWAHRSIRFHRPGDDPSRDRVVVPPSLDKDAGAEMNPIALTEDERWLLVTTFGNAIRTELALVDLRASQWTVSPLSSAKGPITDACVVGSSTFVAVRDG